MSQTMESAEIVNDLAIKSINTMLEAEAEKRGLSALFAQQRKQQLNEALQSLKQSQYIPAFTEIEKKAQQIREGVRALKELSDYGVIPPLVRLRTIYLSGLADAMGRLIIEGRTQDEPASTAQVQKYLTERRWKTGRFPWQFDLLETPEFDQAVARLSRLGHSSLH